MTGRGEKHVLIKNEKFSKHVYVSHQFWFTSFTGIRFQTKLALQKRSNVCVVHTTM